MSAIALVSAAMLAASLVVPASAGDDIPFGCEWPVLITASTQPTTDPVGYGETTWENFSKGEIICAAGEATVRAGYSADLYPESFPLGGDLAGYWIRSYDGVAIQPTPAEWNYALERETAQGGWLSGGDVELLAGPSGGPVAMLGEGTDVLVHEGYEIVFDGATWVPVKVVETGDEGWLVLDELVARSADDPEPNKTPTAAPTPSQEPSATPSTTAAPESEEDGDGFQVDGNVLVLAGAALGLGALVYAASRVRRKEKTSEKGVL